MSMNDPIADMLTRVRNAVSSRKATVDVLKSKLSLGVAEVLRQEGYVDRFETIEDNRQGLIRIFLKYDHSGQAVFTEMRRVSKPGCRVYRQIKDIAPYMEGLGISILTTSQGVMSDRKARQLNIGGEVICTVF
jgi:small subunit ribosomal protein S8